MLVEHKQHILLDILKHILCLLKQYYYYLYKLNQLHSIILKKINLYYNDYHYIVNNKNYKQNCNHSQLYTEYLSKPIYIHLQYLLNMHLKQTKTCKKPIFSYRDQTIPSFYKVPIIVVERPSVLEVSMRLIAQSLTILPYRDRYSIAASTSLYLFGC